MVTATFHSLRSETLKQQLKANNYGIDLLQEVNLVFSSVLYYTLWLHKRKTTCWPMNDHAGVVFSPRTSEAMKLA